jgi:hypothetical protein
MRLISCLCGAVRFSFEGIPYARLVFRMPLIIADMPASTIFLSSRSNRSVLPIRSPPLLDLARPLRAAPPPSDEGLEFRQNARPPAIAVKE